MKKEVKKFLNPNFENELLSTGRYTRIIGIDEVGRGCWAGPVAVGAYIFDFNSKFVNNINDSKMLTKIQRNQVYKELSTHTYSTLLGSLKEINEFGIGKTIEHLIDRVVERFYDSHTYFLIDGQFAKNFGENSIKVIKGDSTYYSIAAASILAKVERDTLMEKLDLEYPAYGFAKHKGYATKAHRMALSKLGICKLHRTSFAPIRSLLT